MPDRTRTRRKRGGLGVAIGAAAAFLGVLTLLAGQARHDPRLAVRDPRVVVVRRVYRTVVVERVVRAAGPAATTAPTASSIGPSVSSSGGVAPGSGPALTAVRTRTS